MSLQTFKRFRKYIAGMRIFSEIAHIAYDYVPAP